ncbi:MAG: flavin prenyltransferase UbiX [Mariprofundaceae bacterium]|nr:flavin prenyltransferase UbiX [Mariprofundaceae bacterium]
MREIIVAITGASGSQYATRLIQRLAEHDVYLHLILSDAARIVLAHEVGCVLSDDHRKNESELSVFLGVSPSKIKLYALKEWFSPVASGSSGIDDMVIVPCSMGSLARIACGMSENLIERSADVILKEKKRLILVPRETPLSSIHLENMLKLSRMNVHMLAAMPGFYHGEKTVLSLIDFIVDRILDHLKLDGQQRRWGKGS